MHPPITIETPRLRLRQWCDADKAPFAALNADPEVMRYFPALLSRTESDAIAERCASLIRTQGWGFWATERKDTGAFIGFVGLHQPSALLPFSPCVEIGWRLAAAHWRQGFAREAARGALQVAFGQLGLSEVVSFTTLENHRSRAVMEGLGMHPAGDFEHPQLPPHHRLRPHCLYRLPRADFRPAP